MVKQLSLYKERQLRAKRTYTADSYSHPRCQQLVSNTFQPHALDREAAYDQITELGVSSKLAIALRVT